MTLFIDDRYNQYNDNDEVIVRIQIERQAHCVGDNPSLRVSLFWPQRVHE